MANYELVNADQLDSDLTAIGNAIRSKGGTSAKLSFPSGMVSAIGAISTGVELNFEVVGGTGQPSSPKENTIWVNTSTTITDWVFSATQPTGATGKVWISIGTNSNIEFNALKKNGIQVYPISAKQYVSGAWVNKTAKCYQNGAWVEVLPEGTLYYRGTENTNVTGGWVETCTFTTWGSNTTTRSPATKNNDSILLSVTSGTFKYSEINTSQKIDFTGYKTLVCNVTVETPGPWWGIYLMSALTSPIPGSTTTPNIKAQKAMTSKDTGTIDISIDVSGVTESLYIVVAGFKGASGDPNIRFKVNEARRER